MVTRPFDGRIFDPAIFDCDPPHIRVIVGGWTEVQKSQPGWSAYDLTRGTSWNTKAKGQSTW